MATFQVQVSEHNVFPRDASNAVACLVFNEPLVVVDALRYIQCTQDLFF